MKNPESPARSFLRTLCPWYAALLCSAGNCAAAIPAPERLLPDDTLVVLTMPDFTKIREIYRTSPQTQLWNDPAIKPFRDKFMSKLNEELIRPLERELGVRLDDYANLPQGQLTLALTQNGWRGSADPSPGLLLLLDAKDKSSLLKTNLAAVRRKWVDAGKAIKTEKIRGLDFTVLPLSGKDIPQTLRNLLPGSESEEDETNQAPKSEVVFGQFESLLIAGNSTRAVEKVVAHLTGGSAPALGDLAAFEANRLALFRDAPFYGWANLKAFIDILLRNAAEEAAANPNPFSTVKPDQIVNALGIGGLRTLAFNVQNPAEGVLAQFFVGVPEAGRQGLFKLFPAPGKESGPPPFAPADAVKFQRVRIDGQKIWAALEKIVNDISPGGMNMFLEMANAAAKEKDPDFDIRKNVIGNLGDDMISYQKAPTSSALADLNSGPSLFLLGSPHADQLAAALKLLFGLAGGQAGPPTEREFLGRKIHSAGLPPMLGALLDPGSVRSGKASRPMLNFAASGGYIGMATDATILEEFLRSSDSQQKKLRDTPGLLDAATRAGGSSTGWFGYENQAETSRAAFEALRKGGASAADDAMLAAGIPAFNPGNPFKEWLDFSLLPPFERIAKYFYFVVYTGSANADGLSFKVFYPVPPQLRK